MHSEAKTIIVTGAGSGLGFAIAQAFHRQGADVVLTGRTEEKLRQAAARFGRSGRVAVVKGDVTQPAESERIVSMAVEHFGRLDVLVNNAGIFFTKPFTEYTVDDLDAFLGYLRGTFVLTQAFVRQLRKQQQGGAVINIGTILTENGVHGLPSSAPIAAKGGITALTKNLSAELATENIRINTVAPGIVPTPLYGQLSDDDLKSLSRKQPLGRYGTPKDIADAVVYLANAPWVTGVVLPVDGGVDAGGDGAYHGAEQTIGACACPSLDPSLRSGKEVPCRS